MPGYTPWSLVFELGALSCLGPIGYENTGFLMIPKTTKWGGPLTRTPASGPWLSGIVCYLELVVPGLLFPDWYGIQQEMQLAWNPLHTWPAKTISGPPAPTPGSWPQAPGLSAPRLVQ